MSCVQLRDHTPKSQSNIARCTTDPEIDSLTWIEQGNNMASLTLVANLVTRWRHLHKLQIWPPDGATFISCKFGHQMAPLHKSTSLALPHCLELPPWHYQQVLSWYLHQPESHQLSQQKWLTYGQPDPTIGPQVDLGPIKMTNMRTGCCSCGICYS